MTPQDVRGRVIEVATQVQDPEAAHSDEDKLLADVLQAIADGADDPSALAREALRSLEIRFPRWCA